MYLTKNPLLSGLQPTSLVILAILALTSAIASVSVDLLAPVLPVMSAEFGDNAGRAQLAVHVFYTGFGLSHLVWGRMSDRIGRRPTMLTGLVLYGIGTTGCLLADSLESVLVYRALQGIGAAVGMILTRAIIRDIYGPALAARAVATMYIFFFPVPIALPLLAAYITPQFGWLSTIWTMLIVGLLALALVATLLMETAAERPVRAVNSAPLLRDVRSILANCTFRRSALANMFCYSTILILLSNISYLVEARFEFTLEQTCILLSLVSCCLAGGVLIARATIDNAWTRAVGAGLLMLACPWAVLSLWHFVSQPGLLLYGICLVIYNLGGGILISALPGIAMAPFSNSAGTASSIFGILQYGGSALIAFVFHLTARNTELNVTLAITMCALLCLASHHWLTNSNLRLAHCDYQDLG